jgi:site-specific DNA-methyltransferase (adenine-specific)
MKTQFFRFMMLLVKNGHNMTQNIFRYVPVQDFNENWSDDKLYNKYNLQQSEIKFINSVIKERN